MIEIEDAAAAVDQTMVAASIVPAIGTTNLVNTPLVVTSVRRQAIDVRFEPRPIIPAVTGSAVTRAQLLAAAGGGGAGEPDK